MMEPSESTAETRLPALKSYLQASSALIRLGVIAVAGIVSFLLWTYLGPGLHSIEERVGALGWTISSDRLVEERVTIVAIDEESIAEIGPWPWSRNDMASLVRAINLAGAQLQIHDITYPESREGDDDFLAALNERNASVIAQVPALEQQTDHSSTGMMTHPMAGFSCRAGPLTFYEASDYIASAAVFSDVPKGHNAALIESDGAVRKAPALVCVDGKAFPALAISAFLQSGIANDWAGRLEYGDTFFEPYATLSLEGYPGFEIPLDKNGALRISFSRSPGAFRAVSAVDVIKGSVDSELLDGAWVLIGGTAFGMADIVPTPYSGATYGVELQARILASMLDGDVPYTPLGASLILTFMCALFGLVLFLIAGRGEKVAAYGLPIAAIALPILSVGLHAVVLASVNLWIGWMMPSIFGSLVASGLLLVELGRVRMERSRVFVNLSSYLPSDIAKEIAFSIPSSNVNARRRNATLLSADLRNFSAFGEARPPEEIAALLHFFFTKAAEIIEAKGGRVQEYRGDGVLAIWDGADCATAQNALQAARQMQDSLGGSLPAEHAFRGLEPLALGIGLEQGPVLSGSIGPAHRRSHTLLGDTVSIALRIQEMTAELAQPILLGECISRQLPDISLDSQGSYLLPGLRIPHTLFALSEPSKIRLSPALSQKFSVVRGGRP